MLDPERDAERETRVRDMKTENDEHKNEGEEVLDYASWAHDSLVRRILELEQKLKRQNMSLYV